MPRFQLQSPNGMTSTITSSDPEIIGRWFIESLKRDGAGFHTNDVWRLDIYPLFLADDTGRGWPDWCPDTTHGEHNHASFANSLDGLIATLTEIKEGAH